MIQCLKCKAFKPKISFKACKIRKSKHFPNCLDCVKETKRLEARKYQQWKDPDHRSYMKTYRVSGHGKESARRTSLKRNYNLTYTDYNKMLEDQNGVCKLCTGINKSGYRLSVDHNHKTGKVRGLLCSNCNRALGWFKDDIIRLEKAIKYLKE